MTIVGLYPPEASIDQPAKVAFYLLLNPENAGAENNIKYNVTPFEHGDAEMLLTFFHDFQELIHLKGVTEDFDQQVPIVRLLLQDDALKKFNGNYIDPVITAVDATNNVQEATQQQNQTH
jgi:hypothetical protein